MSETDHNAADLAAIKAAARKAAFVRRKGAFEAQRPGAAGHLAEVLAGYRGVPLAGYMAIRTEIDPVAVMAEAAALLEAERARVADLKKKWQLAQSGAWQLRQLRGRALRPLRRLVRGQRSAAS